MEEAILINKEREQMCGKEGNELLDIIVESEQVGGRNAASEDSSSSCPTISTLILCHDKLLALGLSY